MDEYGYAATLKTALRMFEAVSRQTGRTHRMIERVRDGDTIVVSTEREVGRVRGLLREAGKDTVRVIVLSPDSYPREPLPGRYAGRTLFDHHWVLLFYEARVEAARRELDLLSQPLGATDDGPDESAFRLTREFP